MSFPTGLYWDDVGYGADGPYGVGVDVFSVVWLAYELMSQRMFTQGQFMRNVSWGTVLMFFI